MFVTPASASAVTTNGDLAHASVGSSILDFFSGVCRKDKKLDAAMEARITELMPLCWAEDPLLTMKLLFYKRDCREGAGERRIFELGFNWVLEHHLFDAIINLEHVPEYGSWKDVEKLFSGPAASNAALMFAEQLERDNSALIEAGVDRSVARVSLAAKWAPTLGGSADSKHGAAHQIARVMKLGAKWERTYRHMLRNLRDHLAVTEALMSAGKWDAIDFSKVPSLAMQRYRKAFERHTPEKWQAYIASLKRGETKVNSKQLMPHEIISTRHLHDPLTQHQWDAVVADVRSRGTLKNALAMCDVSGSMSGLPMDVSIALGVLVSEVSEAARDLVISFTEQPRFFDLKGLGLAEKVSRIQSEVGYNTNLRRAFEEILKRAADLKLEQSQMPDKLIIISDMQFDQAITCGGEAFQASTYEDVKRMYAQAGYRVPQVIFWNVRGASTAFPVTEADRGVCMVSGFSQNILNSVLGDITNPRDIMLQTLNSERYSRVTLA
jgi:hypothetical protein